MKLFNTLTRKVQELETIEPKKVKMFVCGPTVYDVPHLGHAKTYVQMDLLARVLRGSGYEVFYLQNITDIDDKIILRSIESRVNWKELSTKFEKAYVDSMRLLNNTSVNEYARATDHIDQIIDQVNRLLKKGYAYIADDGVYFEVSKFSEYGKLSHRTNVKPNDAQSRIDESTQKRGWNDFCLWKFSKPDQPVWAAEFGDGRPGWHIEDTAITEQHLGAQYDIHGGAIDLIFPHHEAELTQMEAVSGKSPFVRSWVHAGFLKINEEKMSKSLKNFLTPEDVYRQGYDPKVLRFFLLQSHYRSAINFSWDQLIAAQSRLNDVWSMADAVWQPLESGMPAEAWDTVKLRMMQALQDDLNTPVAFAILGDLISQITSVSIHPESQESFRRFLLWLDEILGLNLANRPDITNNQRNLIKKRAAFRKSEQWHEADQIRDQLLEKGIGLRDIDNGQMWYRV